MILILIYFVCIVCFGRMWNRQNQLEANNNNKRNCCKQQVIEDEEVDYANPYRTCSFEAFGIVQKIPYFSEDNNGQTNYFSSAYIKCEMCLSIANEVFMLFANFAIFRTYK